MSAIPYFPHLALARNIRYTDNPLRIAHRHLHFLLYLMAKMGKRIINDKIKVCSNSI